MAKFKIQKSFGIDSIWPFTQLQFVRRLLGGRWARVTGLFWGRHWIMVPPECVEAVEEDWRHA